MKHDIRLSVNGIVVERKVEPRRLLSDFLRHDLDLTGTHVGCEHGVCGACTILLDGDPVRSCLVFAVQVDGAELSTVEGLATGGDPDDPEGLSPLQRAFQEHHALQCGFCTPGILMTLHAYLREAVEPDRDEIRQRIAGHLCRCTGYHNIVEAAWHAARASQGDDGE